MKKVLLPVAVLAAAAAISMIITILRPAPLKLEAPDTAVAVKTLTVYAQSADLLVESQGTVLPRTRTQANFRGVRCSTELSRHSLWLAAPLRRETFCCSWTLLITKLPYSGPKHV